MREKLTALIGIALVCAVALGGLWIVADWFFDRLEDAATPGPPRIDDEVEWLSYTPDRTLVDVDDLHAGLLDVEAELRTVADVLEPIGYRPIRDRTPNYDTLIGAEATVEISAPVDPQDLRALGFVVSQTHAEVPQTTYPITGPPPTVPWVEARRDDVRVLAHEVQGVYWLTFSVRPAA